MTRLKSRRLLLLLNLASVLYQCKYCFATRRRELESETDHRYIIKFDSQRSYQEALNEVNKNGTDVLELPEENCKVMMLEREEDIQYWVQHNNVKYVEKDHKVYLHSETTPYGINMVQALDVKENTVSNQKVCIIDSGYDLKHPDLQDNTEIVSGSQLGDSLRPWHEDVIGHGTHVAGTIAGIGSNGEGIVGINRSGKLKLHIVKIFDSQDDFAWMSNLIAAVNECVAANSTIINMSIGSPSNSTIEEEALERIYNSGVLLIASAGNGASTEYSYPASYDSVISVTSINEYKELSNFTQRNDQVDLAAPGDFILSTIPRGGYGERSGTSMAAAQVSGVAALVWSNFPTSSVLQIRLALQSSAEDLGSLGRDDSFGYGLVNANSAFNFILGESYVPICVDSPQGWHDADGSRYDCNWYSEGLHRCAMYGQDYRNLEKTASQACCGCGGGETFICISETPLTSPSMYPSTPSIPTTSPSQVPTVTPTILDSVEPTTPLLPSESPSDYKSDIPTLIPSQVPTIIPSKSSDSPSRQKSDIPTLIPSQVPTIIPTKLNSTMPTSSASESPSKSKIPSSIPSQVPTIIPNKLNSTTLTSAASESPSRHESNIPSSRPTIKPFFTPVPVKARRRNLGIINVQVLPTDSPFCQGSPPSLIPTIQESAEPTSTPSELPSRSETNIPSMFPSQDSECQNSPIDWHDSGGTTYNCAWYSSSQYKCQNYGHRFENLGKTANEACCTCGGGLNTCEDVEGWHDSGGVKYNCEWYALRIQHCQWYGQKFENKGYVANQACCSCK